MARFLTQGELRKTPLENPFTAHVVFPRAMWDQLRMKAAYRSTTAAEIVRVLVAEYIEAEDAEMSAQDARACLDATRMEWEA